MKVNLRDYIRNVQDFPEPGIGFKDISPLLSNPIAFRQSVHEFAKNIGNVDHIVGLDARGFIFGAAVAYELGLPFSMIRKAGKLPFTTFQESYQLEYGENTFEIHTDSIKPGMRVAIVDDLLATGGSADAACKLITKSGGTIVSLNFLIELDFLKAREKFNKFNINSLLHY